MAEAERIVSFLPSATEMACALGLSDRLMGVTHECDYPPEVSGKPIVVRSALPIETMTQREIDAAVRERLKQGLSLYEVDEHAVGEIVPDLILTQDLCQVCAPSGNEVSQLLAQLPSKPRILWQTPKTIGEIFDCIRYCSGHWVPEMVRIAGGVDGLGREGADSVRVSWSDVRTFAPEVLIIMPCGFDLEKTMAHGQMLSAYEGWGDLPAVRAGRVYAVDANAYFSRPGPRVIEGTELLAHLMHPTLFAWNRSTAFRPLQQMLEQPGLAARPQ
jgi:iron complex transport system substrate-binding protein